MRLRRYTNYSPINAQNPKELAKKMCTWPVSWICMPKQILALHMLLYSKDFFIRLFLQ
jgi:hypothetical protein